jgi:phage terminase large subunit-like protein
MDELISWAITLAAWIPADWARRAVFAYNYWHGAAIVAERNFGGAMVAETLRHVDPNIPIRKVVASRGAWWNTQGGWSSRGRAGDIRMISRLAGL